jgi:hypothetical protein
MSKTFTNGGYSVTVHDDRSIKVQPGDWVSKYSAAIYGDPLVNWDRFKRLRGNTYIDLVDPNSIVAGETLYHPGPLPGEKDENDFPPVEVIGRRPKPKLQGSRLAQFFDWLGRLVCPVNEWSLTDSGGGELSGAIFTGHIFTIGAQRARDPEKTWYYGVGAGLSLGPESIAGSFTMSTTNFPSRGVIGKFITAGTSLSKEEICGAYLVIDFGVGVGIGWSPAVLLFGFNLPPGYVIRNIVRYLRGDDLLLPQHILPMGMILMHGLTATTPQFGVSMKAGWMHRKECVVGHGN